MLFGKGVQEEVFEKSSFQRSVAGLATTLAAGIADSSSERSLLFALQTKVALEITVTFDGAATDGARVRTYEYFTSGSPATQPSNEGTIPVSTGDTVIQTFHFEIRSPYYTIEIMNLDAAQSLTSISAQVIEYNEPIAMQTPLDAHLMYHDGDAWKRQEQIATETTLAVIETAIEIIDDWDDGSDRANVNLNGDLADLDSGAGTDDHEVVAVGLPGAGGHVVGGTATNPLRIDPTGTTTQPVSIVPGPDPASWDDSAAYESNTIVKASTGTLFGFTGYNSGVAQWIQVHDASSLPANGAVPEIILRVQADANFVWSCDFGKDFSNGIVVCNSSTGAVKTIGGNDCWFNISFQ